MKKSSAFRMDLRKYYFIGYGTIKPPIAKRIRIWIYNYGLHCVASYRFGQWANRLYSKNRLMGFIPKVFHLILSYLVHMIHHVDIDAATIGPGLYIGHVGTIYIGPVDIGSNFSITHNVTIGSGHFRGKKGVPSIGNNVWLGTGSVVSGAITIGNQVTINSGCILSRSIPDGFLAGGNPGRLILQNYDNRELLGWSLPDD